MRKVALDYGKPKLMAGVMLAALLSACSSDVSRFGDDPFGNPFKGSSRFEPASTGSIKQPSGRDMRKAAYEPVSTGSVTTQTLANPGQSMPSPNQPIINNTRSAVQGLNPTGKVSGLNPSGVAAANYPALAPVAQRSGSALSSGTTGWSAVGGTPVTLGEGDSVSSLSNRYGVPASAILAVNGLSPSSQLSSGQQIMIPAYNAVNGAGGAKSVIQRPVAAMKMTPPKPVERITETTQAMPTMGAPPARLTPPAPAAVVAQAMPKAAGPARQVGAPVESDAEKRAAAKLRELKTGKASAANDEDEDEAPKKRVEAPKAAPVVAKATPKAAASNDDDEDEAPVKKRVEAPKATPVASAKAVEDPALKAARVDAEKARLEAVKARAEADKAKAEMEKAKLAKAETAKVEKAKAEKTKAEKIAKAKKATEDDVETTASIPTTKLPERAPVEQKLAKAEPVKADEPAKETASNDSFRWPAKGRVISGFGARGTGGANDGINIAVPEGTPVRAAEGGTVVHADDALKGYGKMVLVRHPNGYVSVYAHNGELNVKRGETVKRGQVIAHSGASGNVTAPQLHFELRKGSTPVDPTARLAD